MVESGTHDSEADLGLPGSRAGNPESRGHTDRGVTISRRQWWQAFAVQGVFWRRFVDWAVCKVPGVFYRPLIWAATGLFFFIAAPARENVARNLRAVLKGSSRLINYLRVLRVFANFGWSLADSAGHGLRKKRFQYQLDGEDCLRQLAAAKGAIVLTAHMGNYDLGAALFAQKFEREMRMVRAPEPDARAAQHVDLALQQSGAGAVKVGYNTDGISLALDLLNALRNGEIISIQGDRVVGEVSRAPVKFFSREVFLPNGPFVLALASGAPIYPLFIVRAGSQKYKIIAREPIVCSRSSGARDEVIAQAMKRWSVVLEQTVRRYWPQWYAFAPFF